MANSNFEALTPAFTWAISINISAMRCITVLLKKGTLSNFTTISSTLLEVFAADITRDSAVCNRKGFQVFGHLESDFIRCLGNLCTLLLDQASFIHALTLYVFAHTLEVALISVYFISVVRLQMAFWQDGLYGCMESLFIQTTHS